MAVSFSVAAKLALAGQVRKNHRRQSVDGLSIVFYIIGTVSYLTWVVLGFITSNWVLILAQAPGAVLMMIVGIQWLLWRQPPPTAPPPE